MLKAKLDSVRKNKKGFSLVELIIVIAIMVALIAVMAPQFIKYVQQSRDAVVTQAAEDVLSVAKAEFALTHLTGSGTITVRPDPTTYIMTITFSDTMVLNGKSGAEGAAEFEELCGIDANKPVRSDKVYYINIQDNGGGEGTVFSNPEIELEESTTTAP